MRMIKRLLTICIFVSALLATSSVTVSAADMQMAAIEQSLDEDVSISVDGQSVTISGAQGQVLEVVSLTGRRIMSIKIESPAQRVELNIPKGCYILKIGKVVRKVSIH